MPQRGRQRRGRAGCSSATLRPHLGRPSAVGAGGRGRARTYYDAAKLEVWRLEQSRSRRRPPAQEEEEEEEGEEEKEGSRDEPPPDSPAEASASAAAPARRPSRASAEARAAAKAEQEAEGAAAKRKRRPAPPAAEAVVAVAWVGGCRRTEGCVKEFRHRGRCRVAAFEEVDYEVESILEERCEARRTQFLVKWKGWPISDATWEDEASLSDAPEVVRKWRARCLKGEL